MTQPNLGWNIFGNDAGAYFGIQLEFRLTAQSSGLSQCTKSNLS